MGRPRSVFNRDLDTERTKGKQYAQNRQNITGMSSTFRGMPLNAPQVSGGQTNRVGQDTLKIKTMYLDSLRVDGITRVDLATVSGGAGITSTVASGQYHDFKVGSTSLLNIGPTNVTFKNTILAPAIDLGTISSRIGGIYCDSIDVDNDLKASGDIILGDSTAGDTIDITALFISPLYINGQNVFFDIDQDSRIYSGSDDSIKIVTGGILRMEVNNSGIGLNDDLFMVGNVIYLDSDQDTYLHSTTDDSIQIATGGSVRMSVGNTASIVNNALSVLGNSTLGDSAGDSITLNGLVNFANNYSAVAQTASDSTGYITVLIGGSAKKLYYY